MSIVRGPEAEAHEGWSTKASAQLAASHFSNSKAARIASRSSDAARANSPASCLASVSERRRICSNLMSLTFTAITSGYGSGPLIFNPSGRSANVGSLLGSGEKRKAYKAGRIYHLPVGKPKVIP